MRLGSFILYMKTLLLLQGSPSGRGILFVDMKLKVPPQYKLLILKRNSFFKVNKKLSSTRWATLYIL